MKIVALVGHAGSGKDTVGGMFPDRWGHIAFADPLKEFCRRVFKFSEGQLYGSSEERNRPDPRWRRPNGEFLTARFALQTLGTEWGRNCDPDIWAKAAIEEAAETIRERLAAGVVITDCRFINEARTVRDAGGDVWQILRPGAELGGEAGQHRSELEQDSPEMEALVTARIWNTGTIDALKMQVEELLRTRFPAG